MMNKCVSGLKKILHHLYFSRIFLISTCSCFIYMDLLYFLLFLLIALYIWFTWFLNNLLILKYGWCMISYSNSSKHHVSKYPNLNRTLCFLIVKFLNSKNSMWQMVGGWTPCTHKLSWKTRSHQEGFWIN